MTAMAKDPIPTSRLRRSATVGRLAAEQAARQLGTRAANVTRNEERANAALARRQVETAEQIVAALGTMKGAAMKLGQVMSFLDVGLVPEEYREQFQAKLAELRDAAPKVSFKDMKRVIEGEYGDKLENVFETFDPVPIAAASIGQVYRARLDDGRDVAVKVQYPGVGAAVRADMQNLGMILRLMKSIAPGLDPKALAEEIRGRIDEELDYELEAQNQRTLARIFRGHPFIVIPDVVTSLSHERVIVSEFVYGRGFEEMKQLGEAERNRIAEIVFRFYFGCMYRHHQFSGDPHPGNCMLLDDGRMAFLDFGLFKRIPASVAEFELDTQRLGIQRRGGDLIELLHGGGFIGDPVALRRGRASCSSSTTSRGGTRATRRSCSSPRWRPRSSSRCPTRARATSARCATRRCRPTTSSGAAWRRSRSPSCRSCTRKRQLAPRRARVDLRRRAGHRPRAGRRPPSTPAGSTAAA